jgi:hypothetical protein
MTEIQLETELDDATSSSSIRPVRNPIESARTEEVNRILDYYHDIWDAARVEQADPNDLESKWVLKKTFRLAPDLELPDVFYVVQRVPENGDSCEDGSDEGHFKDVSSGCEERYYIKAGLRAGMGMIIDSFNSRLNPSYDCLGKNDDGTQTSETDRFRLVRLERFFDTSAYNKYDKVGNCSKYLSGINTS